VTVSAKRQKGQAANPGAVARVCWGYFRREPKVLAVIGFCMVAMTVADVALPIAIGALIDTLSTIGSVGPVWGVSAFVAVVGLALAAHTLFKYVLDRTWNGFSARSMQAIQMETFARVQRFSADWHANTFAGATVHKISRGRWALDAIGVIAIRQIPLFFLVIGLGAVLTARFPAAGAMFFAICLLFIAASWITAARWVRPAHAAAAEYDSRLTGAVADSIGNNPAVKSFGAEAWEEARVNAVADAWRARAVHSYNRASDMNAVQQGLWALAQTLILLALAGAVSSGQASAGDVAFAMAANLQLGGQLRTVGQDIRMLQRAIGEIEDAVRFLESAPDVADPPGAQPLVVQRGEIVFDAVCFSYPGQGAIYRDFDLRIQAGERVGLVGATGAGKSTFVKLIQRLYDLDGGAIRIDGADIALASQQSLRSAIAVVPQEPSLFHRSLADNIAYARPGAPMEDIVAAAKRARAHDFISALPEGYQTFVGERGVKLSGGERQRVALARAFLADAPSLMLDEATSSLDLETERLVQAAIEDLMEGRTTIIIAHRLSTVRNMDRILVFDGGAIVEQGPPAALLARNGGRFQRLHAMQGERNLASQGDAA
jgi:ATP-binding cassette subfamily B protein